MNTKSLFLTSELIPESEINLVNLSLLLESVSFAHEIQENERIYLTEDGIYPLWIKIFADPHFIGLSTYIKVPEGKTEDELLRFCNSVNEDFIVPAAYLRDGRVWCFQSIYIKEYLQRNHLLRLIRYFSAGIYKVEHKAFQ